jgi:hypothetical protein
MGFELQDFRMDIWRLIAGLFAHRQTNKAAQWLKSSTIPPLFHIQGYGAFLL